MDAEQLLAAVAPHVEDGTVPGAVVGVDDGAAVSLAATGDLDAGALVRISSNTKPIAAALALTLVQDSLLTLDEPIADRLPELAGQRVLRAVEGPIDDTVPAERAATVGDLLTMRLGFGWVWDRECPTTDAFSDAGLGLGPPDPAGLPDPGEWLARFAEFPLLAQPGAAWRYDVAFLVLGELLARAGARPLPELLRTRVLDPLGMADTGFVARPVTQWRTGDDGSLSVFDDGGAASRWATPPAFPDARGGLVSTATDLLRFARALLDHGAGVLTPESVAAMTTDRLTPGQRADPTAAPFLDGGGWGYGVGVVHTPEAGPRYGWAGGLGTLWWSWPDRDVAAVLVTQVTPPVGPVFEAFRAATTVALGR